MDKLEKDFLIDFYSKKLMIHGDRPESLRWTAHGQRERYNLMLEIAPSLDGAHVLDYGCGKGDLYSYLKERGINVSYTGTDINPDLISLANRKHPECNFFVMDIEEEELKETFDYIFVCGVFNNRLEGATTSLKNSIARLFGSCRKGLAATALSAHDPYKEHDLNYVMPGELVDHVVKNVTPYVTLRHDRVPYDITLFLYREPTPGGHEAFAP
jgi:SAM-dependent methyltransferase